MTQIKIDIEESKAMLNKGLDVIVLKRGKQKYYAHVVLTGSKETPWELVPLSKEEMKTLNIQESYQGETENDWNVDVEESVPEPTEKKIYKINANDPASILAAKQALERVENAQNADSLAEENADLKGKLGLLAEQEIEKKIQKLGVKDPKLIEELHDPEKLSAFEKGFNKEGIGSPSGSAPMSSDYYSQFKDKPEGDILKRPWKSPEEMIMYLRANKSAQNEAILKQLWVKAIEVSKQNVPMKYPADDPITKTEKEATRDFIDPSAIHEENSELARVFGIIKNPLFYSQKYKEEFERAKKERLKALEK
jgi:hypothetical protein